jgi:hypothetical protein
MSLSQIEAELEHLKPDELRRLAIKSWGVFTEKERRDTFNECNEDDLALLQALDDAIVKADATPDRGLTGNDLRACLGEWTNSK